jgi:chemotaxis protein CheX
MSANSETILSRNIMAWKEDIYHSLHEVFSMMLGMKVSPAQDAPAPGFKPELTAIVGLAGSLCGLFIIRSSKETGSKLAEKMLGAECEEHVLDALGELCNMLAGSFKSRIPEIAATCMLSVPTTISGEDYVVHTSGCVNRFEFFFECGDQPLQVILNVDC